MTARAYERLCRRPAGAAVVVSASVVGVGALFLPALAAAEIGASALASWVVLCLLGFPLALTFASLGARVPGEDGAAGFAARAFGPVWRPLVTSLYLTGFAVGQIVVSLVGGSYVAGAVGLGDGGAVAAAALVVVLAVGIATRGLLPGPRARLWLFVAVAVALLGALAAAAREVGDAFASWPALRPGDAGAGAFLLLFAFVGWEAAARSVRDFRDPARASARVAGLATLLVLVVYGSVAVAAFAVVEPPAPDGARATLLGLLPGAGGGVGRTAFALFGAAVCIWLCAANVAATARMASELASERLWPAWPVGTTKAAVGAAVLLGLIATLVLDLDVATLLAVPNAMALTIYAIAGAAGLRLLGGRVRAGPLAVLAGAVALAPFARGALLVPALVAAAVAARLATTARPDASKSAPV